MSDALDPLDAVHPRGTLCPACGYGKTHGGGAWNGPRYVGQASYSFQGLPAKSGALAWECRRCGFEVRTATVKVEP